jgi:UDP-N-acetylglucosamine:LPS N-acetylglucosamine transferase
MSTRVLILTASTTPAHDQTAPALADALRQHDARVEVVDGLTLAGWPARAIIGGARYALTTRVAALRRACSGALDGLTRRGIATFLREHPADVVVATHPLWSQLLGRMRADGGLQTPAVSAIADLAALDFWAHPGIDLHLVTHPDAAAEARDVAGSGTRVEAVHGLTGPGFLDPPERSAARTELALPTRGSLVAVSGGAGDLSAATDTALHYGADTAVVLAGHDERARVRLQAAYADDGRVQVWGVADSMVTLLAAADALIHATAGLTVLEAWMCDCRVIAYGRERGRIRANNRAYERLGMVAVARTRPQLAHALIHALAAPPVAREVPALPAAADLVLGLTGRVPARAG